MQLDTELYRRDFRLPAPQSVRLSAIDIHPENPRRTILFLHGFAGNANQWKYQLEDMAGDQRLIALDLRGHGQSAAPDGAYDMDTLVGDLERSVEQLEIEPPFVLVSHSFGGAIAVEYGLRNPEKVDKQILIAVAGQFPIQPMLRRLLRLPKVLLSIIYLFVKDWVGAPPNVLKPMYRNALGPWRGWEAFKEISIPTMVIRGDRDRVFEQKYFERVAASIPGAQEVNVRASGHMVMLERRLAVNRAIQRFIDGPTSWRVTDTDSDHASQRPWLNHYGVDIPTEIDKPDISLDHFLTASADNFPERTAIQFQGASISYRKLEHQANRFARGLRQLGIDRGDRVMILLPNLPQTIIATYGVFKAGAVASFTSPLSEPEALLEQLENSGAKILVTFTPLKEIARRALYEAEIQEVILTAVWESLPRVRQMAARTLLRRSAKHRFPDPPHENIHNWSDLLRDQLGNPLNLADDPDSLAVLQYTGGTTDTPKGVMLSHRNLVSNTLQIQKWLPDSRAGEEVIISVLPFSHIYGFMTAMSVAIALAATMVVLPTFETQEVLESIRKYRPTLFPGVPTMYTAISEHPDVRKYGLDSIRACISGAAPLAVEVQESFEKLTRGRLVEGYGLTEAGPVTHANPLAGDRKVGSIGIPLPSTDAKVFDLSTGEEAQVGAIGELAVRGPQVMMGYWRDAQGSAEALNKDGWLLTGDIARMDADGYFQIIARKKEMILAGEFQVFPRDVEEILYEHPKVFEAVAVGVQKPRWPFQRIKAYIVLREGQDADEEEFIKLCRERLEDWAVPWQIEFVDELPKSFVGKVLRRVLIEADPEFQQPLD